MMIEKLADNNNVNNTGYEVLVIVLVMGSFIAGTTPAWLPYVGKLLNW